MLLEMHGMSLNPRYTGWVSIADDKQGDADILTEMGYLQKRVNQGGDQHYKITDDGKSASGYAYMQE